MPRLLLLLPSTTYRATAFVEAARRLGVALTVASEFPSTFEREQPDGLLTLDFSAPERAALRVLEFAREHPIAGVLGVDDDTVVAAAVIALHLGLEGNPSAAALAARDKQLQRELLSGHGVRVPAFAAYQVDDDPVALARAAPYPCVLKPLRLSGSRGVIRADNPDQFVSAFRRVTAILAEPEAAACGDPARRLLVEEFIAGPEVALEGLLLGGRLEVLALFDKPDPLDGPFFEETIYVAPSRLPGAAQAAIAREAQAASAALGLVEGPVHAELRWNAQGAWLIELAARPIGGRCSAVLRFGENASLEEIVIRHALGMELPVLQREASAAGVMMIPVPRRGLLQEVRGIERARAVALVEEVAVTARPGRQLVPWPEGSSYPGFIFARGETAAEVEAALREAHRRLEFVVD